MSDDVLIRVDRVSKKFCRDLKRSLWYGVQDTVSDLLGRDCSERELRRDEFWAVDDVSFELKRGECLGLIGRNGAGKTTLLKMLNGLIKPDRGCIEMRGRVGALIAIGAGFNPVLTGRENIYVNGAVLGMSRKEINAKYDEIVDFADIGEFIDAPVQSYSSGMQVRLGFAVAVAIQPHILLLDEVLAVGDVNFQAKCFNTLAKFRKEGTAFILVTHNMHMISRYCQSVLYFREGRVRHSGDVDQGLSRFACDVAASGKESDLASPQWLTALGSGKIKFTGARFRNRENRSVNIIAVGDSLRLELDYERIDPTVKTVVLSVAIRTGEEIVYRGTNVSAGTRFDILSNTGKFFVYFEYIPINSHYIIFSAAILDGDSAEIHDWKQNLRLNIQCSPSPHARLVLPCNWAVRHSWNVDMDSDGREVTI